MGWEIHGVLTLPRAGRRTGCRSLSCPMAGPQARDYLDFDGGPRPSRHAATPCCTQLPRFRRLRREVVAAGHGEWAARCRATSRTDWPRWPVAV